MRRPAYSELHASEALDSANPYGVSYGALIYPDTAGWSAPVFFDDDRTVLAHGFASEPAIRTWLASAGVPKVGGDIRVATGIDGR